MKSHRPTIVALCMLALGATTALLIAGPLNPPSGSVASTYKTLTEVEPRHAINSTNTPGDDDSNFKITQPGSYYLTGDLTGQSGKRGIEIATNDVTIDLNGFTLRGVTGALEGIACSAVTLTGIVVQNGIVRGWPSRGIDLIAGPSYGGRIEGVTAENNGLDGIKVGNEFIVMRCTSINNGQYGIMASSACTISNCSARGNGGYGFICTSTCAFSDCSAYLNGLHGFCSIFEGAAIRNCSSSYNSGDGFNLAAGSTITNCSAAYNDGSGFLMTTRSTIEGCTATLNAVGATSGANIKLTGADNRVAGNNCSAGLRGIQAAASGNFISRNVCSGNTTNWDVVAGNACLVVNASMGGAILGNSGGVAPGSTDPNANFTY